MRGVWRIPWVASSRLNLSTATASWPPLAARFTTQCTQDLGRSATEAQVGLGSSCLARVFVRVRDRGWVFAFELEKLALPPLSSRV